MIDYVSTVFAVQTIMKSTDIQQLKIPQTSGVYIFKERGSILYIGKATSLRDRVKSYFGRDLIVTRGPLLVDMVTKASTVDWQETDSVLEALILEAALIKKHQPYYNTKEKDDKSWNYVCITKPARMLKMDGESFPKVLIIRGKEIDFKSLNTKDYSLKTSFGPFTNGNQLREAMQIIRRIFPYIDTSSSKKQNYEFYRQIGLTPDLRFENETLRKDYLKNIRHIKLFFEGKKKRILQSLKKDMMSLAKVRAFERAGEIKRQIFALEHINDVALLKTDIVNVSNVSSFRIEAYDVAHMSGKNMVGVMTVVENGQVNKSEYRKFKIRQFDQSNDTGALQELLVRRLGHAEWTLPNLIVIDGSTAQLNAAKKVLQERNFNIDLVAVVKDERHRAKEIIGTKGKISNYEKDILLANSEAHRFAITYHKLIRGKNFLK